MTLFHTAQGSHCRPVACPLQTGWRPQARAAVGVDLVGGEGAPAHAMSMDVSAAQGEEGEGEGAGGDVAMGDIEGEWWFGQRAV